MRNTLNALIPSILHARRMIIDRLRHRQDMGLTTSKQIRCLERYGFRKKVVSILYWKFGG